MTILSTAASRVFAAFVGGLLIAGASAALAQSPTPSEAKAIAEDAYIYGYSLITTEVTRVQMSNVDKVEEGLHAPMGQLANVPRYPPANYRGVSAPNADTLYSVAWLDLAEPQVFSHPDTGKRFYLFEMTDLWMTDFETPGTRSAGDKAATYLITGPGWNGAVPDGMKQIKSATRYMVILGRTFADGTEEDYKTVNALQAQYKIVPVSASGKSYTYKAPPVNPNPGFSMTDAPQAVILGMETSTYFNMMAKLMSRAAPPAPEDAPILARMAKIGLVPGQQFDMAKLDPTVQAGVQGQSLRPRRPRVPAFAGMTTKSGYASRTLDSFLVGLQGLANSFSATRAGRAFDDDNPTGRPGGGQLSHLGMSLPRFPVAAAPAGRSGWRTRAC